MDVNRIKPGQGIPALDRLNSLVAVHNDSSYEFWIEWQPQPDREYDLRSGYYLHAIYEYTQIDRSLTELSERWRNFKYGIWLGAHIDSAAHNLADAVEITKRSFERRVPDKHPVRSTPNREFLEV